MHKNLRKYLILLDKRFGDRFSDLERAEKSLRPKSGYRYCAPSQALLTETANLAWRQGTIRELSELSHSNFDQFVRANPEETGAIVRTYIYDLGRSPVDFEAFLWVRKEALADLIQSTIDCVDRDLLLPSLISVRSALEQIGNVTYLRKSLAAYRKIVNDPGSSNTLKANGTTDFMAEVSKRALGTRIDWETYITTSFHSGKKRSYKAGDDHLDIEAGELLSGVDQLDKLVKGVRMCYEFLCEFSHPNVGVFLISRSHRQIASKQSPYPFFETIFSSHTPSYSIDILGPRLLEVYDIFFRAVGEFSKLMEEYEAASKMLRKVVSNVIKSAIENYGPVLKRTEPCPCLSGKEMGDCCGKHCRGRLQGDRAQLW